MPAKNIIKEYVENGVYHVYNRGINKNTIFNDEKDYATFLYFLKLYLSNPEDLDKQDIKKKNLQLRKNFYEKVTLIAYCLMPNHFHLLIRQKGEKDVAEFIKCVTTNYSMYFNDRNQRIGPVFQGTYKAVLVKNDDYLLHLSRYIHLNPLDTKGVTLSKLSEYEWSSYADYLGKKDTKWVKPKFILDYFENNKGDGMIASGTYQNFIEEYVHDTDKILEGLTLD